MGRHKKDDADSDLRSIKCALRTIVRPMYYEQIAAIISLLSIKATKIACLASLLLLMKVNEAVDDGIDGINFFATSGKKVIHDCFMAVVGHWQHILPEFYRMVNEANIVWPTSNGFGSSFTYLWEQYETNVKTNLKTHCENRLRIFFKMRVFELNDYANRYNYFNDLFGHADAAPNYDDVDVKNAVNYTYARRDTTNGDAERELRLGELLDELRAMGAPDDCNIRDFCKGDNWFESMRMWIEIQRDIRMFHLAYSDRHDKPKISNFTVVPKCYFQRRHICIDVQALYAILASAKLVPLKCGVRKGKNGSNNMINITKNEFTGADKEKSKEEKKEIQMKSWNLFFDLNTIGKWVNFKKDFHNMIHSDGVSVSVIYDKPKVEPLVLSDEQLLAAYRAKKFKYEFGNDPGERTWHASVRRDLETKEEVNMRISSKRYHWDAKQNRRNAKAELMTRLFTFEEQSDLKQMARTLGEIPSPRGASWHSYIEHRLRMMNNGIDTYSTAKYARLQLDKHIESVRAIDKTACKMVLNQPAIIYMGASGSTAPNSPIKIKKHVRCPGTRKLLAAFFKRGNCVIRMVDEYMTSQHCARCFRRFPIATRKDRYKKCVDCIPNPAVRLPTMIVTNVSKRALQMRREIERTWRLMREMGDAIVAAFRNAPNTRRLVSKKQCFLKTWQPNAVNVGIEEAAQAPVPVPITVVWHRDVVAAKLILYKGHCKLTNKPIHPNLVRPRRNINNVPLPFYGNQP